MDPPTCRGMTGISINHSSFTIISMSLTLQSYISQVKNGSIDPQDTISQYLQKAKESQPSYNAFIRLHEDYVSNTSIDTQLLLAGAPIAIKDNIMMKSYISSCGSRMMENYVAPYDATCFAKLQAAG